MDRQSFIDSAAAMATGWDLNFEGGGLPAPAFSRQAGGFPWDMSAARAVWQQLAGRPMPDDGGEENMALWLIRWFQSGLPRFDLTHQAATAFALTDAIGIRWDDLRFPFDTMLIDLPTPSPIRMRSVVSNGWVDVRSIRVHRTFRHISREGAASLEDVVDKILLRRASAEDTRLFLKAKATMPESYMFLVVSDDGTQMYAFTQASSQGETVDSCLFSSPLMTPMQPDDERTMRAAISVAINTALWLTQENFKPAVKAPERRQKNLRKPSKNDSGYRPVIYTVGGTIKLNDHRTLLDLSRAHSEHGAEAMGWKVKTRHTVRGHWKQQPFGTGRTERRRMFVQPYWRGPEASEALAKTYSINAKEAP